MEGEGIYNLICKVVYPNSKNIFKLKLKFSRDSLPQRSAWISLFSLEFSLTLPRKKAIRKQ